MKKGLAIFIRGWQFSLEVGIFKIRKGRRLENSKWRRENERESFRGFGFSCFSFCLRHYRRESYNRRVGFPFCKTGREYRERKAQFESLFSPWKRKVGVPWASVVFLSSLYMYMYLYLLGFHEWWKMCLVVFFFIFPFNIVWLMLSVYSVCCLYMWVWDVESSPLHAEVLLLIG